MTEYEIVAAAEAKYGVEFKKVTNGEYRSLGGCVWCGSSGKGSGSDRFRLFIDGPSGPRVWCRQCDNYEFLDADNDVGTRIDKIEMRLAAVERKQKEHEDRLKMLEIMKKTTDHVQYYKNMVNNRFDALEYWISQGMNTETIDKYMLGYCDHCPTAPYSASYTIPIMYRQAPYNIRHRLIEPNGTGKYRPHMAGLPSMLFNADNLDNAGNSIMILEGEKKSMVVGQETGFPNVAIMGIKAFKESWVPKFDRFKRVYVALDPDADEDAYKIATMFNGRGRIVELPMKADDFFVIAGGNSDDFMNYVAWARPV